MDADLRMMLAEMLLVLKKHEEEIPGCIVDSPPIDDFFGELDDLWAKYSLLPEDVCTSGNYEGEDDYCRDWFFWARDEVTDLASALSLVDQCVEQHEFMKAHKER